MHKQVNHLRDDIRRTFTTYALIPVFIISMISIVLAFTYWDKNVIDRNHNSREMVSEALSAIVTSYMDKAVEIAATCDLGVLKEDKNAQTKMYEQLYAQVNIIHANADFYLVDENLQPVITNRAQVPDFLRIPKDISWGIIAQIQQNPTEPALAFIGDQENFRGFSVRSLAIGQAIMKGTTKMIEGYIIFVVPGAYLLNAISNPYVQFVVTDSYDYMPIATNYVFGNEAVHKIRPEVRDAEAYFSYEKEEYYMTKRTILDGMLRIYAITPIGGMLRQFGTAAAILLGVLVILSVTIVISVKRQTVEKTKVIDQLVEAFEAVKQGNLDLRLQIKTHNEFEIIAEAYNTMLISLKNLMRMNNEKARETVISEIKQLESQFNPHFLFNTLENIKFMIKLDPIAANKMIIALSTLLRYSINNKIGEVTIREDLEYTQNYLDIQKYRFGERLDYSFLIEEAAKNCIVPKLIIQPLIENAIKYGFKDSRSLAVELEVAIRGETLILTIFNSGVGIDTLLLSQMRQMLDAETNTSQHMGLCNVNRRIKLMYGAQYGVEIKSEKNLGTTVKIILPVYRQISESAR